MPKKGFAGIPILHSIHMHLHRGRYEEISTALMQLGSWLLSDSSVEKLLGKREAKKL